jgi:hypothetical protein
VSFDGDELAGTVDPFGALSRAELREAAREVAFRRGDDLDDAALAAAVDDAVAAYRLVVCPPEAVRFDGGDGTDLLAVGPTAFPEPPEGAEDLPHILGVDQRSVDRERLGRAVVERLRGQAARAVDRGEHERVRQLLDVSYDVEAWAPVDVSDVRERFDSALEE